MVAPDSSFYVLGISPHVVTYSSQAPHDHKVRPQTCNFRIPLQHNHTAVKLHPQLDDPTQEIWLCYLIRDRVGMLIIKSLDSTRGFQESVAMIGIERTSEMPVCLLDLPNELLARICGYVMVYEAAHGERRTQWNGASTKGLIGELLSKKLRQLLLPMRAHPRLHMLARHEFLESNVITLDLGDFRWSACRLEHQPSAGQLLYTGNPDPLLAKLVHVQITISVSDTRMRNSFPREASNLKDLVAACHSLKTLHIFLKVDAWFASETDLDIQSTLRHQLREEEIQFAEHVKAIIALLSELHVKVATVAFHQWMGDAAYVDVKDRNAGEVVGAMLGFTATSRLGSKGGSRVLRVRTMGMKSERGTEKMVKKVWGAADDLCRIST